MRGKPEATTAPHHLFYWVCQLRRGYYADIHVLRSPLLADSTYLLLLYGFRSYLPLAADHHHVPFSPFQGQEAQRAPQPD